MLKRRGEQRKKEGANNGRSLWSSLYRDRRQDVALEMERNYAAPKQSQVRPSNQLLLSFPPFPVRHPGADHGNCFEFPS